MSKKDNQEAKKLLLKALIGGKANTSYDEVYEALEHLGLNNYETQVYLFVATHVPMSASQIARELDLDRSKVYREIDVLIQKGLITQTLDNPRLCIITDCATAIDGLIREWEDRFINGKRNKDKIIDYIQNHNKTDLKADKKRNHIAVLTSRNAVFYHICSALTNCQSNVIIYTSAVDLTRMNYTEIPELLRKISKTNTCTIVIDKDLNGISKKYKGCRVIKIRKQIEGRIIIIEDQSVVMSSRLVNDDRTHKDLSDVSLAINEPQIVRNMQQFVKMVLG